MRAYAFLLQKRGIHLVLVVDNPPLSEDIVFCPEGSSRICSFDPAITSAKQGVVSSVLNEVAVGLPNVHIFDPSQSLLDSSGRVRYRDAKGTIIYSDGHHLSVTGSRSLAKPFESFLIQSGLIPPLPR
jgi:hypothetical protein